MAKRFIINGEMVNEEVFRKYMLEKTNKENPSVNQSGNGDVPVSEEGTKFQSVLERERNSRPIKDHTKSPFGKIRMPFSVIRNKKHSKIDYIRKEVDKEYDASERMRIRLQMDTWRRTFGNVQKTPYEPIEKFCVEMGMYDTSAYGAPKAWMLGRLDEIGFEKTVEGSLCQPR
jgi:hypothetical protein